jgi:hypothetical protein
MALQNFIMTSVLFIFLTSCSRAPVLTPEEQNIPVTKTVAASDCQEVGHVQIPASYNCDQSCQFNKMRRRASQLNANYVQLSDRSSTQTVAGAAADYLLTGNPSWIDGRIYRCPQKK